MLVDEAFLGQPFERNLIHARAFGFDQNQVIGIEFLRQPGSKTVGCQLPGGGNAIIGDHHAARQPDDGTMLPASLGDLKIAGSGNQLVIEAGKQNAVLVHCHDRHLVRNQIIHAAEHLRLVNGIRQYAATGHDDDLAIAMTRNHIQPTV